MKTSSTEDSASQEAMADLVQNLQEALVFGKQAATEIEDLRRQLADKQAQLDRKDQIILEKVAEATKAAATAATPVSPALVDELVSDLSERRLISEEDKQAYLQGLKTNPDNLVKLASRLLTISIPSPAQGRGIGGQDTKAASATFINDGWNIVVEQGA
jgi:hypothetical protein